MPSTTKRTPESRRRFAELKREQEKARGTNRERRRLELFSIGIPGFEQLASYLRIEERELETGGRIGLGNPDGRR